MTQIISVITKDYVLLASDRRLTIAEGSRQGEIVDDDTCKLVSLCNVCGIGYTGLARISSQPTHEWIARTLASENCRDPGLASEVIIKNANVAFKRVKKSIRHQVFLIAGWAFFNNMPGVRSHFCVISNALDDRGNFLSEARDSFDRRVIALPDEKEFLWYSIGQPLRKERALNLERNIRRLLNKEIGPKEALRLIVEEIINTSEIEKNVTVGNKILGFCIPKSSVESRAKSGNSMLLAKQPDQNAAVFTYFENGYSELAQYGPTLICGETAMTDITTENDPSRNYQSSQARFLSLPKGNT